MKPRALELNDCFQVDACKSVFFTSDLPSALFVATTVNSVIL